jgi:predicted ATPase/DNA-binding CsgD family transcriptional regulator
VNADDDGGGLPVPLTGLVGRQRELAALTELLSIGRLVSIVGTGGCGKTRLSLALVDKCRTQFPDGVWWVDLDPVGGPGLVAAAVAAAFDLVQLPGELPTALLARHLRARRALVVLDNCEHLVAECAELAEQLLRSCPHLRILVTSREVLGVTGETVYRLGGLDVAEGSDPAASDAVQLFAERASGTLPGFVVGSGEHEAVAQLCQRLDGLPLAIELAAARVGLLSVTEIVDRLDGDARLLRHPSRHAPARHRTLEATLEWSYGLLTPAEQALLRRLSVFQGPFSLLAAEQVGVGEGTGTADVVDLLAALVDKSLVQVADRGVEQRYRLLQRIRHYAHERLVSSADSAAVHRAHIRFYLQLAGQAHVGLEGPDQLRWLDRLELEHDNMRAALRCALLVDPEAAGQLTASLWPFWYRRGYYHEARGWLEQAADLDGKLSPLVRAETLTGAGVLAFLQCDYQLATDRLEEARALYHDAGHRAGVAAVVQRLGSVAREQGRYDDARRLHEDARRGWAELGDASGVAAAEDYLAFAAWLEGVPDRAEHHARAALSHFRAVDQRQELAAALINAGIAAHYRGDDQRATDQLSEALAISRTIGYQEGAAWALHELAVACPSDPATPQRLRDALSIHVGLGDRWRTASVLETIAVMILCPADATAAVRLLGACHAARRHLGAPLPPAERPAVDGCLAAARRQLGAVDFDEAWAAGLASTVERAVEVALEATRQPPPEPDRSDVRVPGGLTERELAVLRLLSQGLTNREIGRELFISPGTAGVHVSNILRKLEVSGRVQAAGLAHQLGLVD